MAQVLGLVNELKHLIADYVIHRDYFNKRNMNANEIGTYEFRLSQMKENVPLIKAKKYALDDLELNDDQRTEIEIIYATFKDYNEVIGQVQQWVNVNQKEVGNSRQESAKIKFPTISLPEFDGSFEKWLQFRDSFEALIHQSRVLTVMEKYHYLRSAIKLPAGQNSILSDFQLGEAHYEAAWNAVKERYNDDRKMKSLQFNAFFSIKKMANESSQELRRLIDSFSTAITTLKQLGATWEDMLVHVVQFRLDDQSLKDWQKHLGDDEPTWDILKAFMTAQWRNLDQLPQHKKPVGKPIDLKSSKQSSRSTVAFESSARPSVSNNVYSFSCLMCKDSHMLYQCQKFLALSSNARFNFVKEKSLCRNCFSPSHQTRTCKVSRRCKTCNGMHNTLIHFERALIPVNSADNRVVAEIHQAPRGGQLSASSREFQPFGEQRERTSNVVSHLTGSGKQTLLSTVKLNVIDVTGRFQEVRALLDNGSDTNFITTSLADKLGLKMKNVHVPVIGINERTTIIRYSTEVTFSSQYGNFEEEIQCSVMSTLTGNLPSKKVDLNHLDVPSDYFLADPEFNQPSKVDMLLGADVFYESLLNDKIRLADGPMMIHTKFGWVIGGSFSNPSPSSTYLSHFSQSCNSGIEEIDSKLEKFFELENYGTKSKVLSKEEDYCEKLYEKTTTRDETGRYIVELPTKNNIGQLGTNLSSAYRQFYYQEKIRQNDFELNSLYCDYMRNYIETGHMEEVDSKKSDEGHYLPHHGVKKITSTTTKLRPVFNASSKSQTGLSLNDCLCVGPTVQAELFDIFLRFREKPFVLKSDIEKMYRQVFVHPSQRKFQKILWREDPLKEQIRHYQLNTVTFGVSSAPFLATRTLNQIADDNEHQYPEVASIIRDSFYVDDLVFGVNSIEQGIDLRDSMIEVLTKSKMPTRKWAANSKTLLDGLPESDIEVLNHEEDSIKTLGINWFPKTDKLSCNFKKPKEGINTKASVLSEIASLYDPMGDLGPVNLKAKLVMKVLWERKVGWNQELPEDVNQDWNEFRQNLEALKEVFIDRRTLILNPVTVELHGFCDASEKAYGAAIYLRSHDSVGNVQVSLICSKSRVSPTKQKSIARLELCSATLLSKLVSRILSILSTPVNEVHLWSDSMIALCWIRSIPSRLSTFVGNRVSVVQEHTENFVWKHIRSDENPADVISRGLFPQDIKNCELWWQGPSFFKESQSEWPESLITIDSNDSVYQNEFRKTFTVLKSDSLFEYIETRFSRVKILINVFANLRRFVFNCKNKSQKLTGPFKIEETDKATKDIIRIIQRSMFPQEVNFFLKRKQNPLLEGENIKKSDLKSLAPFMDSDDIIRVGGRLQASKLSFNQKHQIILPHGNFSKILIRYLHRKYLHPGALALQSFVREEYWPLKLMSTIRQVTFECLTCYRVKPREINQFMGSLPAARVTSSSPFSSTAIDYTGSYNIKTSLTRNSSTTKAYIAMFKCMSTGAIHLEAVTSLSTPAFIMTFDRFVSRRGLCAEIFSDNGTYFEGADNEFKRLMPLIEPEVIQHCESQNIKWRFSPPRAPHYGGYYESGIKTIKHHTKRIMEDHSFTYEEFSTVLCKIEAIVNSRPLTPMSENPDDLQVLTPGHFLIGKSFISKPERNYTERPQNRLVRWELLQQLQQKFWKAWSHDYLHHLQERPVDFRDKKRFFVGDMVLVMESNIPPMKWLRGRIVRLLPSKDGVVRVVKVQTVNGIKDRHVKYLCLLPFESHPDAAGENVR